MCDVSDSPEHFRRKQLRSPGFDYASSGMYWVTICAHHMECRFGKVVDGLMVLNDAGQIADRNWRILPDRYPGLMLDDHIVMPNHLHAIVFLGNDDQSRPVSLSAIVGAYKSITTMEYSRGVHDGRLPRYDKSLWQRSFQDRIVQSDRRLEELRRYVEGNPGRWQAKQDARRQ